MTNRRLAVVNALLCAAALSLATVPSQGYAWPDAKPAAGSAQTPAADKPAAPATEDVIYTSDGRELHGQIISETKAQVVFEYRDAKLNIKTRMTLQTDQIAHIDRKVAVSDASKPTTAEPAKADDKAKPGEEARKDFGAIRVQSNRAGVPSFYIVPMKGQMGTDINTDVYKRVRDDIRALKPDVVVIQMLCQDNEDVLYSEKDPNDQGLLEWDEYRELVKLFRDELREFRQVCWIEDSVGISSMVAMSWPEIYMKRSGRFGGLQVAHTRHFSIADLDVRGKMVAALMAWVKSFLEYGGYSLVLADAMVQPEKTLSATWQGRSVIWSLDDKGEYVVDGDDKHTVNFRAKHAEDFGISHGTADTLEDLGLLLGYREFRVLDGQAEKLCGDYVEDWRRAFAECKKLLEDYQQFMGWAGGEDEVKYLGRAMSALEKILANMKQYKAVQVRMEMEGGPSQRDLTIMIEQIKERLRALKNREKAGSGSTGGGGRMGGRGGAGSPGPPR